MDQKAILCFQLKTVHCLVLTFPGYMISCCVPFIVFELLYDPVGIQVNV